MNSKVALGLAYVILAITSFWFYPKWQNERTEATISWDVSGYYWYLPASVIYKDVKTLAWADDIRKKYAPTTHELQSFDHPSGNKLMKYSVGMAVQYLPFFLTAHALAPALGYPADGFSKPYQFSVQFGSLLFCFVGLWFLRKVLLEYFKEGAVAWLLILYALGRNYLNYGAIDGAMTHNWLFSWYAILMWLSVKFYTKPRYLTGLGIGLVLGIMALTRPTEVIAAIIPLAWGLHHVKLNDIKARLVFIKEHFLKYALAVIAMIAVGSIQLIYWKYATGEWLVYSYEDQGFTWLRPHVINYTFNYRSGWLLYTPLMIFAWIGFIPLIKKTSSLFQCWCFAS
jgi:hypothetical protein